MRLFFVVTFLSSLSFGNVKVGQPFPAFDLQKLGGKEKINNAKIKNKVVVVDFWATWCEPCKKELPTLEALHKKYSKKGVVVLGINLDEEEKEAVSFFKDLKISFESARDGQKKLPEALGIATMPTSYVLDKKGTIKFIHSGFREGDEAKIEKAVKGLL